VISETHLKTLNTWPFNKAIQNSTTNIFMPPFWDMLSGRQSTSLADFGAGPTKKSN
jgi:hypothetical protein